MDQTEFVSIALPHSGADLSDGELIDKVKYALTKENSDIQKYQLRVNDQEPTEIEIWRHGSGFSAFAL